MIDVYAACVTIGSQQLCDNVLDPTFNTPADVLNKVFTFLIPIAAVILFLILVSGGFDYLQSEGGPEKLKHAKAKITAGIIGFVLLVISIVLVKLIAFIFFPGNTIL